MQSRMISPDKLSRRTAQAARSQGSEYSSIREKQKVRPKMRRSPVHGEFVNYAAIGIWNRPRQ